MILLILTTICFAQIPPTGAVTAFDCKHQNTTHIMIDLTDVSPCPEPEKDYEPPQDQHVELIQTTSRLPISGYQCNIVRTKVVQRCGHISTNYGSHYPEWERRIRVNPEWCQKAYHSGKLFIPEAGVIPVKQEEPTQYNYFSHGSLDENGNCQHETFTTRGIKYWKSLESVILNIRINRIQGEQDTVGGMVYFKNGLRAPVQNKYLHDELEGTITWEPQEPLCDETVSGVHSGYAKVRKRKEHEGFQNSLVIVEDHHAKRYGGLVVREPVRICREKCYRTQVKDLNICFTRPDRENSFTFRPSFDPTRSSLQTQVAYLHMTTNLGLRSKFSIVNQEICELDRRTRLNQLRDISGANNPHALLDLYGPGHRILAA